MYFPGNKVKYLFFNSDIAKLLYDFIIWWTKWLILPHAPIFFFVGEALFFITTSAVSYCNIHSNDRNHVGHMALELFTVVENISTRLLMFI